MRTCLTKPDMSRSSWLGQFFVYGLVGGISTALDWGTFYLTNNRLGLHYVVCTLLSILIGSSANFTLNRFVTFKNKSKRVGLQVLVFSVVSATSILLSIGWMYLLVNIIRLLPLVARMTTTLVMYPINFLLIKFFVFDHRTAFSG
jgi:putative flippase GtrA